MNDLLIDGLIQHILCFNNFIDYSQLILVSKLFNSIINEYTNYCSSINFMKEHRIKIKDTTFVCKLKGSNTNIQIYTDAFARNVSLDTAGIVHVSLHWKNLSINRSIREDLIVKKRKNQVTILMELTNVYYIQIQMFKNGLLQISGCRDIYIFFAALNKLMNILSSGIEVDGEYINFINTPIEIKSIEMSKMNSKSYLGHNIDLGILLDISAKEYGNPEMENWQYRHEQDSSFVMIDYQYDNDSISICVSKSGVIVVIFAKKLYDIIMAHQFIYRIIKKYHHHESPN